MFILAINRRFRVKVTSIIAAVFNNPHKRGKKKKANSAIEVLTRKAALRCGAHTAAHRTRTHWQKARSFRLHLRLQSAIDSRSLSHRALPASIVSPRLAPGAFPLPLFLSTSPETFPLRGPKKIKANNTSTGEREGGGDSDSPAAPAAGAPPGRGPPAHGIVAGDGRVVAAAALRLLRSRALQERQRHRIHEHGRHPPQHLRRGAPVRRRGARPHAGARRPPHGGGGLEGDLRHRGPLRPRSRPRPHRRWGRRSGRCGRDDAGGFPGQGGGRQGYGRGGEHGGRVPGCGGGCWGGCGGRATTRWRCRRKGEEEGPHGSHGPRGHAAAEAHDQEPRICGEVQGEEAGLHRRTGGTGHTA